MTKIQYNIIDYMTHNRYNTILWHWRLRINLVEAIMDDYDTFPRNSAKRIFDIGYLGKSTQTSWHIESRETKYSTGNLVL